MTRPDPQKVAKWAEEQKAINEQMGPAPSTGATGIDIVGTLLVLAFRLGLFIGFCVVIYLIGRAVVGG